MKVEAAAGLLCRRSKQHYLCCSLWSACRGRPSLNSCCWLSWKGNNYRQFWPLCKECSRLAVSFWKALYEYFNAGFYVNVNLFLKRCELNLRSIGVCKQIACSEILNAKMWNDQNMERNCMIKKTVIGILLTKWNQILIRLPVFKM